MVLGKVCQGDEKKMTSSLFRPWMEERTGKSDMASSPYPHTIIPTETEVWFAKNETSEMAGEKEAELENSTGSDREIKYKNVKEHMKRRSEKYLMKRLKATEEKKMDGVVPAAAGATTAVRETCNPWDCLRIPEVSCQVYASPTCFPSLDLVPGTTVYPVYPHGTEYLDATLTQGFPPNLFEEYARFLTEQQKQVADRSRKQRPKKFRCPQCQVGFSNNGQLKGHIRIHTGERPFKCDADACGKSFTRNEELTRHRRIHLGLRPFPCPECGKRFGRKDHLKKHVKTHFQQRYQLVPILSGHYPYLYGA